MRGAGEGSNRKKLATKSTKDEGPRRTALWAYAEERLVRHHGVSPTFKFKKHLTRRREEREGKSKEILLWRILPHGDLLSSPRTHGTKDSSLLRDFALETKVASTLNAAVEPDEFAKHLVHVDCFVPPSSFDAFVASF